MGFLADMDTGAGATEQLALPDLPAAVGIYRFGLEGLAGLMAGLGQPGFRAGQLIEWLYGRGVASYDEMSNLPAALRGQLDAVEPLALPRVVERQVSQDGARKYLLELADGCRIESVGIPEEDRLTVCFSTQVGCALDCRFCATGQIGLTRQLAPGEMAAQLITVARDFGQRATNAVAMGEGEPFANYAATLAALRIINHPRALAIGARRITVSTSGLLAGIRRFAAEPEQFTLAVSLHSAVQTTRDALMPSLRGQTLVQLHEALQDYIALSGRRVSLEYALVQGQNDTPSEIAALKRFCLGIKAHVNLIPLNPGGASPNTSGPLAPSAAQQLREVERELLEANIECSVRRSRGADIAAACGQLAGR